MLPKLKIYFRKPGILSAIGFLVLVLISLIWASRVYDITFDSADEIHMYMDLIHKVQIDWSALRESEWAPLYQIWYYCLSFFEDDVVNLYLLNSFLMCLLIPVFFYLFLKRSGFKFEGAIVAALFFLVNFMQFTQFRKVNHFLVLMILILFYLSSFVKKFRIRKYVFTFSALLVSLIRPEYLVGFLALLLISLLIDIKNIKKGYRVSYFAIILCFVSSTVFFFAFPAHLNGGRNVFTFKQKIYEWYRSSDKKVNHIVAREKFSAEFGSSDESIIDIVAANPTRSLEFFSYNITETFRRIGILFKGYNFGVKTVIYYVLMISFILILGWSIYFLYFKRKIVSNLDAIDFKNLSYLILLIASSRLVTSIFFGSIMQYLIEFLVVFGILISIFLLISLKHKLYRLIFCVFLICVALFGYELDKNYGRYPYENHMLVTARTLIDFNKAYPAERVLITCRYYTVGKFLGIDSSVDELCCSHRPGWSQCGGVSIKTEDDKKMFYDDLTSGKWAVINLRERSFYMNNNLLSHEKKQISHDLMRNPEKYGYRKIMLRRKGHLKHLLVRSEFDIFFKPLEFIR